MFSVFNFFFPYSLSSSLLFWSIASFCLLPAVYCLMLEYKYRNRMRIRLGGKNLLVKKRYTYLERKMKKKWKISKRKCIMNSVWSNFGFAYIPFTHSYTFSRSPNVMFAGRSFGSSVGSLCKWVPNGNSKFIRCPEGKGYNDLFSGNILANPDVTYTYLIWWPVDLNFIYD